MSLLRKLLRFAGLQLISVFAPLFLLPLVARSLGPADWGAFSVAQAVGAMGASIVAFSWPISGQSRVALASTEQERAKLYSQSVRCRLAFIATLLPIELLLTHILTGDSSSLTTTVAGVSAMLLSLSPNWFAVGTGQPRLIGIYDTLPKLSATAVSIAALTAGLPVLVYPTLLGIASITGFVLFNLVHFGTPLPLRISREPVRSVFRDWGTALHTVASGLYVASVLPIAGMLDIAGLPGLASIDRLFRYSLLAIIVLGNAAQHWALGDPEGRAARRSIAIRAHVVVGLLGMLSLGLLGSVVTGLLFGQGNRADTAICWAYGAAFFAVSASTPLVRLMLAPIGSGSIQRSSWWMMGLGLPLLLGFGWTFGAAGLAVALAAGYVASLIVQVSAVRRLGRMVDQPVSQVREV